VAQQGSRPPRPGRPATPARGRGAGSGGGRYPWPDDPGPDDEEYPPWAGPGISPRWATRPDRAAGQPGPGGAGGPSRDQPYRDQPGPGRVAGDGVPDAFGSGGHRAPRGFRSKLALARARRARRMLFIWGAALAAVAVIATVVVPRLGGTPAARHGTAGFVTTFQPGELKTVPQACASVSGATLDRYLPGKRSMIAPHPLDGRAQSLCDWTADTPPLYRHLEVTVQAYAPSGLASGDGSATAAAGDAYALSLAQKAHPPKATHLPRATITAVHGLAGEAFTALQVVPAGGITSDLMTVVARDRNVLVTVTLEGIARSANGRYGPVPASALQSGALAAARDIVSHLG
jgi:hypothetical protein